MVDSILVPMDGSPKSKEGLEHALAEFPDIDITVLHVMTPYEEWDAQDPPLPESSIDEWYEYSRDVADEIFREAREIASTYDTEIATAVEVGEPWRAIVNYTEEHGIDYIVMGSHGRSEDTPLALGSVAETVMRRAPVVVSIVR